MPLGITLGLSLRNKFKSFLGENGSQDRCEDPCTREGSTSTLELSRNFPHRSNEFSGSISLRDLSSISSKSDAVFTGDSGIFKTLRKESKGSHVVRSYAGGSLYSGCPLKSRSPASSTKNAVSSDSGTSLNTLTKIAESPRASKPGPGRTHRKCSSHISDFVQFWAYCVLESIFSSEKAQKELPAMTRITLWSSADSALYYPGDGGQSIKMRPIDFVQCFHSKCVEVLTSSTSASRKYIGGPEKMRRHAHWFVYHTVCLISFSIENKWISRHCSWIAFQFLHKLCSDGNEMKQNYLESCEDGDIEFNIPREAYERMWKISQEMLMYLRSIKARLGFDLMSALNSTEPTSIICNIVVFLPSRPDLLDSLNTLLDSLGKFREDVPECVVQRVRRCVSFLVNDKLPPKIIASATQWFRLTSSSQVIPGQNSVEDILKKQPSEIVMKDVLTVASCIKSSLASIKGGLIPDYIRPLIQGVHSHIHMDDSIEEKFISCIISLILHLNPCRLELCKDLSRVSRFIMSRQTSERLDSTGMSRILPSFNADPVSMVELGLTSIAEINSYLDAWNVVWGWILTNPNFSFWV